MTRARLPHLLRFSRRRRPRLTWRDIPNLIAGAGVVWLWFGLNWIAWAFLWRAVGW